MTGRFVVGDQPLIFALLLLLVITTRAAGEVTPMYYRWGMGVVLFMLVMSLLEQLGQSLVKARSPDLAVPLLLVAAAYRRIGAFLPIPWLGKLYIAQRHQLADAYCLQLKYDQAIKCMEKANAIAKSRYGDSSPEMAEGLINMSYIYSTSDRPELAEQFGEQGMKIFDSKQAMTRRQQENLCMTLNNLGIAYANSGKTAPALELLTRSIRMKEQLVGANDPSYGMSLANVGYTFLCAKEYEQAEKFLRMANAIPQSEKLVIATVKNNFGDALRGVKKLDDAEKLLVEALSMREGCLPARHPHFGYSYHNLGKLYAAKGDRERAEKYFKMAIDLRSKLGVGNKLLSETKEDYQNFLNNADNGTKTTPTDSISSDITPLQNTLERRETT